jgi:hypothetical protein
VKFPKTLHALEAALAVALTHGVAEGQQVLGVSDVHVAA